MTHDFSRRLFYKIARKSSIFHVSYYKKLHWANQKWQIFTIVYLENAWNTKQMITEGEAAILLETTRRAFGNQSQSKQRSTLVTVISKCILI